MKKKLIEFIRGILPQSVLNRINVYRWKKQTKAWEENGRPLPPPHMVKQQAIEDYQKKYNLRVMIETGTFRGDMIEAQKKRFDKIFSIELADIFYKRGVARFKNDPNVKIIKGDSGKVLPEVLDTITEPALFWLDGHYSSGDTAKGEKDCPIYEELNAIFNGKSMDHVLLIDDARCFNGQHDYPTIEALTAFVKSKNKEYQVEVKNDIIRFVK